MAEKSLAAMRVACLLTSITGWGLGAGCVRHAQETAPNADSERRLFVLSVAAVWSDEPPLLSVQLALATQHEVRIVVDSIRATVHLMSERGDAISLERVVRSAFPGEHRELILRPGVPLLISVRGELPSYDRWERYLVVDGRVRFIASTPEAGQGVESQAECSGIVFSVDERGGPTRSPQAAREDGTVAEDDGNENGEMIAPRVPQNKPLKF